MSSLEQPPHLLKVKLTADIRDFLRACLDQTEIRDELEEKVREEIELIIKEEEKGAGVQREATGEGECEEFRTELKFRTLKQVFSLYRNKCENLNSPYFADRDRIYLHKLMQGSDVYFTPPKRPPRNPELVQRLARIQQQLDNQAYSRMVANLGEKKSQHGSLAIDMKSLNVQTIHAFNILLSFVCAFVFGFAVGYLCELEHTYSAIIGVLLCVPVLLADVYFLLKYYEDGVERVEGRTQPTTAVSVKKQD